MAGQKKVASKLTRRKKPPLQKVNIGLDKLDGNGLQIVHSVVGLQNAYDWVVNTYHLPSGQRLILEYTSEVRVIEGYVSVAIAG